MTSQIVIEIKTDKKNENVNVSLKSFIPISSSDKHKEVVETVYKKIDKILNDATG
ncbi:hypothetical protein KAR91_52280 [Candidatus Pacearchaeota archaeon]|nr:hypothetical protein [Candidatus Pacearchaeota archaeon]